MYDLLLVQTDLKRRAKERLAEYVDHDTTLERKENKLVKKAIKSYLTPVSHAHLFDRDVVIHGGDDGPHKTVIMKDGDYKDIEDHDEQLIAAEVKSSGHVNVQGKSCIRPINPCIRIQQQELCTEHSSL